jgi:hypothetical protein
VRGSRCTFPKLHLPFGCLGRCLASQAYKSAAIVFRSGNAMQRTILTAILFVGIITTAHAQTTTNTGTDPLGVPTSTLSSSSSFSTRTPAPTTSGSVTSSDSAAGSSGINAPSSRRSLWNCRVRGPVPPPNRPAPRPQHQVHLRPSAHLRFPRPTVAPRTSPPSMASRPAGADVEGVLPSL